MKRLILSIFINALALWVAHQWVPGFTVSGQIGTFLVAGLVLGFLNGIIKPILKFFAFPLILLTLGLFVFVINALLLWAVTFIVPSVVITGYIPLAIATLVVTVVNVLLNSIKKA